MEEQTHKILFKNGSKRYLSQKEYDTFWDFSLKQVSSFRLGFDEINFDDIVNVESIDIEPKDKGLGIDGVISMYALNSKAMQGMIDGLSKFIKENENACENARNLLKNIEKNIEKNKVQQKIV